ncbi:efflux RND transporter periplasmic adaptor subunit [bacterium]|nr:efflux RND transporter periplasmic adaptor subunit [bacterium]
MALGAVATLSGLLFAASPRADAGSEAPAQGRVDVRVGRVVRATLRDMVVAYGMVEPEPATAARAAASARMAAPVAGVLTLARCAEGERVQKGDELFRLDTRAADVAITKAQAAADFARMALARQQRLLRVEGTSEKAVQEAQQQLDLATSELAAARAQRALLSISAPLSGVVTRVNVKPGEAVDLTTVLAEVIDLDRLVVTANVPSAELPAIAVGQPVEITTGERPTRDGRRPADAPIEGVGTVSFIGAQIDPRTDTAPVRIAIAPNARLRPGQFVNVRIITEERRDRLAVPVDSLVKTAAGTVVAVVDGEVARQIPVTVGLRDRGLAEVDGPGVREGMTVVTTGAYGLPEETTVRVLADGGAPEASATEAPAAAEAPGLTLLQTIPLPDVSGDFDQMAVDLEGQRLFVAAQDNHSLEVVDLRSGARIRSVPGFDEPKWVVHRPDSGRVFVSTAGDGKVVALDAASFAVVSSFSFPEKANALRFDGESGHLLVGVGRTTGAIASIDTRAGTVGPTIALGSPPKQFALDGSRLYVNEPKEDRVAVVDRARGTTIATWSALPATGNDPLALDRANQRLLVGGGSDQAGVVAVLDTASGAVVASLEVGADPDGLHYDPARHLIYVSCGGGTIDVVEQRGADVYQRVARVPTARGASTSLFVPEMDRLFLAVPAGEGHPAAIRVYQPRP